MRAPNTYAGLALDRAQHRRREEAWLKERLADPGSAVLPIWRGLPLILERLSGKNSAMPYPLVAAQIREAAGERKPLRTHSEPPRCEAMGRGTSQPSG